MPRIRTTPAKSALAAAALCLAAASLPASADTVATPPLSVQGMFTSQGLNNHIYNAGPGNILVGQQTDYGYIGYHNYFVFDLSSLPAGSASVTSATLTLTLPYNALLSPSPSETYTLFDVDDAFIPVLHDQDAWLRTDVYDDLGTGQTYGSRAFTTADNHTTVSLTLDAAALQAIQSHLGSEFALGGALTTLADSPASQLLFAFSGYDTHTALSLTLGPAPTPAAAPLPSTAAAGLALLLPLALKRRPTVA